MNLESCSEPIRLLSVQLSIYLIISWRESSYCEKSQILDQIEQNRPLTGLSAHVVLTESKMHDSSHKVRVQLNKCSTELFKVSTQK